MSSPLPPIEPDSTATSGPDVAASPLALAVDQLTQRLTDQQRAVVAHRGRHARVAAVAGSGKTTTLVARVLSLLAEGIPAQRILVLMFNRSAREDFVAKLAQSAPPGTRLPDIRTFHSIGHRLTTTLVRWGGASVLR